MDPTGALLSHDRVSAYLGDGIRSLNGFGSVERSPAAASLSSRRHCRFEKRASAGVERVIRADPRRDLGHLLA